MLISIKWDGLPEVEPSHYLLHVGEFLVLRPPQPRVEHVADGVAEQVESCLLYTSPSPRDRTRSRMPSSA